MQPLTSANDARGAHANPTATQISHAESDPPTSAANRICTSGSFRCCKKIDVVRAKDARGGKGNEEHGDMSNFKVQQACLYLIDRAHSVIWFTVRRKYRRQGPRQGLPGKSLLLLVLFQYVTTWIAHSRLLQLGGQHDMDHL